MMDIALILKLSMLVWGNLWLESPLLTSDNNSRTIEMLIVCAWLQMEQSFATDRRIH
jgi:hypothetical protein